MGDRYEQEANKLVGDTVVGVEDVGKFDVVLEFESGIKLRVYAANWYLDKGGTE